MNSQEAVFHETDCKGLLENFPALENAQLAELAAAQQIALPLPVLHAYQTVCRSQGKRTVTGEELRFLDQLAKAFRNTPDAYLMAAMTTDNDAVAETLADLMKRRSDEQKEAPHPPSLSAMTAWMDDWASAHMDIPANDDVAVCFPPHRDLQLAVRGYRRSASTGDRDHDVSIGAPLSDRNKTPITKGDYVYAILPDEADTERIDRLSDLLISHAVLSSVKSAKIVRNQCIFPLLLEWDCGMIVHGQKLIANADATIADTANAVFGAVIVASPERSADLLLEAQEQGLPLVCLAKITDSDTLILRMDHGEYRFPTAFLRSLALRTVFEADLSLPEEETVCVSLSRLGTCTLRDKRHALVKTDAAGTPSFRAAILGITYGLAHCVAVGASIREAQLFTQLILPLASASKARFSEAVGSILGLYRMQAEFALWGKPEIEVTHEETPALSSVLLAPLPAKIPSATATRHGTNIYYLEPLYTKDGIPDFADLKQLFFYVMHLIADGKAYAVRPTKTDLSAELKTMGTEISITPVGNATTVRIGGFLIETDHPIQGILVGKTENPEKNEADS